MNCLPSPLGPWAKAGLAVALTAALGCGSAAQAQTPAAMSPPHPIVSAKASPVVDTIAESRPALTVHRNASMHTARHTPHRRYVHYRHHGRPLDVERPALAGVLLVEPIPPRLEAPRKMVPTPAYFVDGIASALTIPPPPIVCERRPRDRTLPDPRLYREVPLECGYDID